MQRLHPVLTNQRKSQLAIQYCHDVRQASPQTWVFWAHTNTAARFEEDYRTIANRLELAGRDNPETDILQLVKDWLNDPTHGTWFMVLDNADNIDVFYPRQDWDSGSMSGSTPEQPRSKSRPLAAYLPKAHGTIRVTSRSKDAAVCLVGSYKNIKDVHAMDEKQAVYLLQNKLEESSDKGEMTELVKALGCLPLVVSQAAAYINRGMPQMTVSRYLRDFQKNDNKRTTLLRREIGDLRRDESASNSVITTWRMSFEQIRKERPSAADLLSLMSFLIRKAFLNQHFAAIQQSQIPETATTMMRRSILTILGGTRTKILTIAARMKDLSRT